MAKKDVIASLKRRSRSQRLVTPPPVVPPLQTERQFAQEVTASVGRQVLRDLQIIIHNFKKQQDGPRDFWNSIARLLKGPIDRETEILASAAQVAAMSMDASNRAQVVGQLNFLGADIRTLSDPDEKLDRMTRKFVKDTLRFVRKARRNAVREMTDIAYQHFREGGDAGTLEQKLVERLGVSQSRAELIARDQTGKYFGALTEARHRAAGATSYIWRTAGDSRVRSEHAARDGKQYSYDNPPPDGHPGTAIRCRCGQSPVFDLV